MAVEAVRHHGLRLQLRESLQRQPPPHLVAPPRVLLDELGDQAEHVKLVLALQKPVDAWKRTASRACDEIQAADGIIWIVRHHR